MNAFTQVRTVAKRDSATAQLKKLGVAKADYNTFIEAVEVDGVKSFIVALDKAAAHVAAVNAPKGRAIKGTASVVGPDIDETEELAKAKPAKKVVAPKVSKRTVTSVAIELIRAGKTNVEVFAALQAEFKLADSKKTYPAWYRRHLMVKHGEDHSKTAGAAVKVAVVKAATPAPKASKKAAAVGGISAAAADAASEAILAAAAKASAKAKPAKRVAKK